MVAVSGSLVRNTLHLADEAESGDAAAWPRSASRLVGLLAGGCLSVLSIGVLGGMGWFLSQRLEWVQTDTPVAMEQTAERHAPKPIPEVEPELKEQPTKEPSPHNQANKEHSPSKTTVKQLPVKAPVARLTVNKLDHKKDRR